MAKEKKTIQVQEIKDYANLVLSNAPEFYTYEWATRKYF
jgi:hypothetical protein